MKYSVAIEETRAVYPKFPYEDEKFKQKIISLLEELGLDPKNPFEKILFDGAKVVLKPNLVYHRNYNGFDYNSLITHSAIIKQVIDLLLVSKKKITITIIDVPLQGADWDQLMKKSKLKKLLTTYKNKGIEINLIDGRKERAYEDSSGVIIKRKEYNGDPKGYATVRLDKESEHKAIEKDFEKFRVTDYNPYRMKEHHNKRRHEYLITKTVLESDLFINLPKLKCHKKGGITVSLKNLVGINGSKDWLPHHRKGSKQEGGDEYPKKSFKQKIFSETIYLFRMKVPFLFKYAKKVYFTIFNKKDIKKLQYVGSAIKEGSWHGNDTLWRTILDINKIIFYADKQGKMQKKRQRTYLSIVDGVIGMDREGPMGGTPKKSGVLLAGFHPTEVDIIAARLMGFDENKIAQLKNIKKIKRSIGAKSIKEIKVQSKNKKWQNLITNPQSVSLGFIPPAGWKGHMELE